MGEGEEEKEGSVEIKRKRFDRLTLPRFIRSISSASSRLMNDESDEKKVNYRAHIYERPRRGGQRKRAEAFEEFKLTAPLTILN